MLSAESFPRRRESPLLLKNNSNDNEQLTVGMQVAGLTGALVCFIFFQRNVMADDKKCTQIVSEIEKFISR